MGTTAKRWTDEEIQWLKDNFADNTTHYCVKVLHAGVRRILAKAQELGLTKRLPPKPEKKVKPPIYLDERAQGYCMDCAEYKEGGYCTNKKTEVGALWKKKCYRLHDGSKEEKQQDSKPVKVKRRDKKEWTRAEDSILREMYPSSPMGVIEMRLNRSKMSVYRRANILGLKRT